LARDLAESISRFVKARKLDGTRHYEQTFREAETLIRRLFVLTHDVREVTGAVLAGQAELIDAARFLGGPPVSADDLRTLVASRISQTRLGADVAERIAEVIRVARDPVRFPWLREGREPTVHEREAAVGWTTGLWTVERLRTGRRTSASRSQEQAVFAALEAAGWTPVARKAVRDPFHDLRPGTFSRELLLAGAKCDVPVKLRDGRLLALECKVSNSAVNSVKRLNREIGGKAARWRAAFGEQVVTGAVLAGVFRLANLEAAQNELGVTLFWDHDFVALVDFVSAASPDHR
jgi:hypothetical protein